MSRKPRGDGPLRYVGANIPADLYDWIMETGAKENRRLGQQFIQLLQEARNARTAKAAEVPRRPPQDEYHAGDM